MGEMLLKGNMQPKGFVKDGHKLGLLILMNLNPLMHSPGPNNPSCEITLLSIIIISETANTF